MIDYFALALGHGLMAIALLRLVLREDCDADPLIETLKADIAADRMATSTAGRNAARRARTQEAENEDESDPRAQVAKR
ncbi:MAG: hypothetical protein RSE14_10805 [Erythrobacter sp.]|jgi:hypothetical protein|uniref:hypothetical protein n=1 Tax=Erythrobacter sp. TaxID=1042 RepID=UPI002B49F08B|nr:hypothetical protein [Erythrobacter sp.]WRH69763.1 MAG: hypothetical protein RSE14_10805 [Erythrobacter sp.]